MMKIIILRRIFSSVEKFGYLNTLALIVLGIVATLIFEYLKKRKAENKKVEWASILILEKQNIHNKSFADKIVVKEVYGEKVTEFIYSGSSAIYIGPGSNEIVVYAKIGDKQTEPKKINIRIDYEKIYTLYYLIETNQYLIYEGYEFEKDINDIINKGKIL
ncbi:hypothetical protein [Oceanivirga salmonicida]|uniref:hypothetical protein n=1 Tax=Oceanivirga salmonicida TaxID=1769291 RepID=UPI00082B1C36|nr:hypothetical protein [Oceanivirga salmonicida]